MNLEPDIAQLAQLLTEPARVAMLLRMMDGRSWTATELARSAGIKAPAASAHLKKLLAGDILRVSPAGRHRYFRLADERIARLLEQLQVYAPPTSAAPGQRRAAAALQTCRLCYDHVAGAVGVAIARAMVDRSWLLEDEPWFRPTDAGMVMLAELGVEVGDGSVAGRTCMDWSERRLHVGGLLGARLAHALLEQRCLIRERGSRALAVTADGWETLGRVFGIAGGELERRRI